MTSFDVVEGFHGPGGWAEGLKLVAPELRKVGVEWDESAVSTARAAGHCVVHADVRAVDLEQLRGVRGVIKSPPCPGFSAAGKGLGRKDLARLLEMVREWSAGPVPRDGWHDERSALTLEVVRWCAALEPEWIALEQVKEVLPVWEAIGEQLRARGYSVWTGLVYAERYGVPQTRVRAILIASRSRTVGEPAATHQRYYPPGHKKREMPSLEEANLPRWVSMAEALGWAASDLVGFPRRDDGQGAVDLGGESYRERDLRPADLPAFNLTEKARSWQRWALRANAQGGNDSGDRVRTGNFTAVERDVDGGRSAAGSVPYEREVSDPAPTVTETARSWTVDRPATTIAGDPRVFSPGGHIAHDGRDNSKMVGRSENAIRVSIDEAAVLQSFRPDYPWQGTKTKQFQQVGNAVPPLLAAAILREVLGLPVPSGDREPVDAEGD